MMEAQAAAAGRSKEAAPKKESEELFIETDFFAGYKKGFVFQMVSISNHLTLGASRNLGTVV